MKLIGFKRFTGKNGKDYCVANVVDSYSQRDIERGCVGQSVQEIFLPANQKDLLVVSDIGKELKLDFEYSGGRAYLNSISVIK